MLQWGRHCVFILIFLILTWGCVYWFQRERKGEREGNINVREKHWLVASRMYPDGGLNLQPRYVPWPGIELVTFWYTGWWSNQLSHPARAGRYYFYTHLTNDEAVAQREKWLSQSHTVVRSAPSLYSCGSLFCYTSNLWKERLFLINSLFLEAPAKWFSHSRCFLDIWVDECQLPLESALLDLCLWSLYLLWSTPFYQVDRWGRRVCREIVVFLLQSIATYSCHVYTIGREHLCLSLFFGACIMIRWVMLTWQITPVYCWAASSLGQLSRTAGAPRYGLDLWLCHFVTEQRGGGSR